MSIHWHGMVCEGVGVWSWTGIEPTCKLAMQHVTEREREMHKEIASLCGGLSPFVELVGVTHTPAGLGWDSAAMVIHSALCTVLWPLHIWFTCIYLTSSVIQDQNMCVFVLFKNNMIFSFIIFMLFWKYKVSAI